MLAVVVANCRIMFIPLGTVIVLKSSQVRLRRMLAVALTFVVATSIWPQAAWAESKNRRTPVVEAVRKVQPSVVSISSEKRAASSSRWPFSTEESNRPRVNGMGSGVLIDSRGYILTNHHVVDKVQGVEVHLFDGASYPAKVLQFDTAMDLALIKIEAGRSLTAITIGTSSDLMVGEPVITIGNAFGYENTVSAGIISFIGRNVTLSDEQVYRNLIQTDASINPGNSGGPLINIEGELIGINVATRAGAQNIGFALPIDDVKRVAIELMSTRKLASSWHGLITSELKAGDDRIVQVNEVQAGSPAELSGFKTGDQMIKVGDLTVANSLDVERALLGQPNGQATPITLRRGGKEQTLSIALQPLQKLASDPSDHVWRTLGLKLSPVGKETVTPASASLNGGLIVQAVTPNSPGSRAMIQKGDILVGIVVGEKLLETVRPENVVYILRESEQKRAGSLEYYIVRRNGLLTGTMTMTAAAGGRTALLR